MVCGSGGWRNEAAAEAAWCRPIVELLRGPNGLERFWLGVGFTDPEAVSEALDHNDARAIAAALEGSTGWRPDCEKLHVPVLSYRGAREDLELNDALMLRLGADTHVLPDAGHLDSFNRSDDVLEFAMPFLRQHAHVA